MSKAAISAKLETFMSKFDDFSDDRQNWIDNRAAEFVMNGLSEKDAKQKAFEEANIYCISKG